MSDVSVILNYQPSTLQDLDPLLLLNDQIQRNGYQETCDDNGFHHHRTALYLRALVVIIDISVISVSSCQRTDWNWDVQIDQRLYEPTGI